MLLPDTAPVPADLVKKWAEYVQPSEVKLLQQACAAATMQSVDEALRPFFATWTTSLMGSDLEKLKLICADSRIRRLIETLIIEDECKAVDPFAAPELPSVDSTYRIWPRNNKGIVIASKLGLSDLLNVLHEGLLRPRDIKIRDYQIDSSNFLIGPEMAHIRDLIGNITPSEAETVPLAVLTRDVVEGVALNVESIVFRSVEHDYSQNSVLGSSTFREQYPQIGSVAGPAISEAVIDLCPTEKSGDTLFSMLDFAELRLGHEAEPYWLENLFYNAPKLTTLRLSVRSPRDQTLQAERVVPKLSTFSLYGSRVSAETIRAMLASSKESLGAIKFCQVVLNEGSTWREVLSFIAKEYQALKTFELFILREGNEGGLAVDYRELVHSHVPELFRADLKLVEKGPPGNKRVTRLSYCGVGAGKVLEIVSAHGHVPESYEAGRGQHERECILRKQGRIKGCRKQAAAPTVQIAVTK